MTTYALTSSATAVSAAAGSPVSIYSLTSSAPAVSATSAVLTIGADGYKQFSLTGNWCVEIKRSGVVISKASSFGGAQEPPVFPVSREDSLDLARTLLKVCT